ncbi:MAG: DNA-formamidopyrimidine glycosylase family protein [Microthrixaceae bacterium]
MPELPEVQAHAERLSTDFAGEALTAFRLLSFSALKTVQPSPDDAIGMSLLGFGRRGKLLLAHFGEPGSAGTDPAKAAEWAEFAKLTFVIHLMQAGRLIPDEKQSPRPKNGVARWTFESGRALLLTEAGKEHKAGIWLMSGDPLSQAPLAGLGIEASSVTLDQLREVLAAKNQRLHGFLRDQSGLAGIGRMLANEICHRAELSPFAMTRKLTDEDIVRLHQAIQESIDAALTNERTLDAMSKSADRPARVHHRKGEPCPICGDTIRAVEYNAYEVDYCPRCQTGGKVLADNTTSKFLK